MPRAIILVLPFLWAAGSIPQADVLLEYVLEQALVHLHGGPYAASTGRLAVMTVLAWSSIGV